MTVEEVLQELRIDYKTGGNEHCTQGWGNMDCPDCSPNSQRYRLGIHLQTASASCWYCGRKRAGDVLSLMSRRPPREVYQLLRQARKNFSPAFDRVHTGKYTVPFPVGPLLPAHRKFLKGRRLDPDDIAATWRVGGIGLDGGKWKWRLFLPVLLAGKPVSWTTRSVSDMHSTRYRSANAGQEDIPHKQVVYGLDHVRHSCLVVEGPTGCWRIGPGTVATFGTTYSTEQVALLAQVPARYVAFDPEPEAQRRAMSLCDRLGSLAGITELVRLDKGADPGQLEDKQVRQLRKLIG